MSISENMASRIVAGAMIITVITQVAYVALSGSGQTDIAYPIWRTESMTGLAMAIFGFVIASRQPLIGGCIALAGLFNLLQTGIGLTMFVQLGYGGNGEPNPVFTPVLGFAFFLYFAAKAATGVAAIALGLGLWRKAASHSWHKLGMVAILVGAAALLVNGAAMAIGMDLVFVAGLIGTLATFLLALLLLLDPAV